MEVKMKIELYVMSLGVLFFFLILKTLNIPIYFGPDMQFVGWKYLLCENIIAIILICLVIISIVMRVRFQNSLSGNTDISSKILRVKNINYNYLMFFVTYIIPLICFDVRDVREFIILIFLLIVLGILFVKTNVYYQNPTLALMGFNLYEVDMIYKGKEINNVIVIIDGKLNKGDEINKHDIDENEIVYCKTN
jgi:hypothetical protein